MTTGRADFGRKCLLARRLVERGVRFVQVYSGGGHNDENWDAHGDVDKNHALHCGETDRPIAGLLTDLKRRGLLDDTLVVWSGEFGRMPTSQNGKGRDHNPTGFTTWLAGGGVKGGTVHRRDRRVRLRRGRQQGPRPRPSRHDPPPAGPRSHPPDLLPRRPQQRLTDVHGRIVPEILA